MIKKLLVFQLKQPKQKIKNINPNSFYIPNSIPFPSPPPTITPIPTTTLTTPTGETTFPEINLKVPPLKGSGVLFYNLDVNGEKDKSSLHASVPVMKGEKWAAVKWLREYDRGYGQEEWDW